MTAPSACRPAGAGAPQGLASRRMKVTLPGAALKDGSLNQSEKPILLRILHGLGQGGCAGSDGHRLQVSGSGPWRRPAQAEQRLGARSGGTSALAEGALHELSSTGAPADRPVQ